MTNQHHQPRMRAGAKTLVAEGQRKLPAFDLAAVTPTGIFRRDFQNFSPAGVRSPFVARAMPTDPTSVPPSSCPRLGRRFSPIRNAARSSTISNTRTESGMDRGRHVTGTTIAGTIPPDRCRYIRPCGGKVWICRLQSIPSGFIRSAVCDPINSFAAVLTCAFSAFSCARRIPNCMPAPRALGRRTDTRTDTKRVAESGDRLVGDCA
jgi:hypothetical protein